MWEIQEPGSKRYKSLSVKAIDAIEKSYDKVMLNKKVGQNMTLITTDSYQLDFTDSSAPKLLSPKTGKLRYCLFVGKDFSLIFN